MNINITIHTMPMRLPSSLHARVFYGPSSQRVNNTSSYIHDNKNGLGTSGFLSLNQEACAVISVLKLPVTFVAGNSPVSK